MNPPLKHIAMVIVQSHIPTFVGVSRGFSTHPYSHCSCRRSPLHWPRLGLCPHYPAWVTSVWGYSGLGFCLACVFLPGGGGFINPPRRVSCDATIHDTPPAAINPLGPICRGSITGYVETRRALKPPPSLSIAVECRAHTPLIDPHK